MNENNILLDYLLQIRSIALIYIVVSSIFQIEIAIFSVETEKVKLQLLLLCENVSKAIFTINSIILSDKFEV